MKCDLLLFIYLAILFIINIECFKLISENGDYNDSYARNDMYKLSAAAFSDYPINCLKNTYQNASIERKITNEKCDISSDDSCAGFIAIIHDKKAIAVVFRGSISNEQVAFEVIDTLFLKKEKFIGGGQVSSYFYKAFKDVWNAGLKDAYLSSINSYPSYETWVTGHSLGASMASLAAATISFSKYSNTNNLKLITFGEPRTGDQDYVNVVDNNIDYSYRVIHRKDPVPHLPFKNMFGYVHHKREVFYDNDMVLGSKYEVCSDEDDSEKCSNKHFDYFFNDHTMYFSHEVFDYGVSGCK